MDDIVYQVGIPPTFRDQAVFLYEQAFDQKISVAIENVADRRRILSNSLLLEFAICALKRNQLVGLAGFHDSTGSLTGGVGYWDLISTLGFFQGSKAALLLSFLEREPMEGELVLDGISVRADYRSRGIGGALLDKVKEFALHTGFTSIRLDVTDANPRAKVLYERHGFRVIDKDRYPYLKGVLGFGGSESMAFILRGNTEAV
jgi:ribosomal protein S18 acetylase RimI-like enzyme